LRFHILKTSYPLAPMSEVVSALKTHFPEVSEAQIAQFEAMPALYQDWNSKINVISRKDTDNLWERHILHSLGIAKVMQFKPGARVMDVGTGGGFPGIPLATLFPETQFHLVDSIGKKVKVAQAVANELGLNNVETHHGRVEKLKFKVDFVVARAVTRIIPFFQLVQNAIRKGNQHSLPNGILYLKGGDLTEEFVEFARPTKFHALSDYFEGEFFETKKVVYVQRFV